VNGSDLWQLTDRGDNLGPCFSPDGEWITFTSFRDWNNEIYIMHTDGTAQTRLTYDLRADWQPRWGP
jgi:Tol biopolymer transport system component